MLLPRIRVGELEELDERPRLLRLGEDDTGEDDAGEGEEEVVEEDEVVFFLKRKEEEDSSKAGRNQDGVWEELRCGEEDGREKEVGVDVGGDELNRGSPCPCDCDDRWHK